MIIKKGEKMGEMKKVNVDARLLDKFRVEGRLGEHTCYIDQPAGKGGEGTAPGPLEMFLFSLAGCILSIARIAASQKRMQIDGMDLSIEGELDPSGLMGMETSSRNGFERIEIKVRLDAPISRGEKISFLEDIEKRCPVADNILTATPVGISLE
jgi:uncharacterized OsmC-like protein